MLNGALRGNTPLLGNKCRAHFIFLRFYYVFIYLFEREWQRQREKQAEH